MLLRWALRVALVLLGAALVHLLAVWLLPRAIVRGAQRRLATSVGMNHVQHLPLPDSDWHRAVLPSPDLLYSACAFDVSKGPLLIMATVPEGYFSISVFADNTDNFFVVNDRTAGGRNIRVVLARDSTLQDPGGGRVIVPPSPTGLILFRQLVLDSAQLAVAEQVQHAASCQSL
jgi:uncharacterized membrane protein